jgi:hypothetical protein
MRAVKASASVIRSPLTIQPCSGWKVFMNF